MTLTWSWLDFDRRILNAIFNVKLLLGFVKLWRANR